MNSQDFVTKEKNVAFFMSYNFVEHRFDHRPRLRGDIQRSLNFCHVKKTGFLERLVYNFLYMQNSHIVTFMKVVVHDSSYPKPILLVSGTYL